ncbi:GAP family protein [Patescibacteria group bacterium]|nr:GAP family protein [Patescibacteria group bacterium]
MNRKGFFIFVLIVCFFLFPNLVKAEQDFTCAVYFTGINCPHCAKVSPVVLGDLQEKYPNLVIIEYEVQQQKENAPLILQYNANYNSGLVIPLIIFNEKEHLIGARAILQDMETVIKDLKNNECPLVDGTSIDFEHLGANVLPGKPNVWQGGEILSLGSINEGPRQDQLEFTLTKILSLAAVDAINPCALAVLILMLITILTYNPENKKKVLLAGLAFVFSVFVMYLFYGLVIVKFFQLVQALTSIRLWLYKVLGVLAIVLGILNIRDFLRYKPGSFGTEMPMFLRPKVKKIISSITSPVGAFVVGAFVTIFLLPCTIGPYVICGGILSPLGLLKSLPWLLLYNLVFVLPMLVIIGIVYLSIAKVQDISDWKNKNIRYLHLIAGIIIFILGLAMVLGWV